MTSLTPCCLQQWVRMCIILATALTCSRSEAPVTSHLLTLFVLRVVPGFPRFLGIVCTLFTDTNVDTQPCYEPRSSTLSNVCFLLVGQRLERCVGIVQSLTNGLSEREANDALTANVRNAHSTQYFKAAEVSVLQLHPSTPSG